MIDEKELRRLKKLAEDELAFVRQRILLTHPFIGSILMRMNLIPVRDLRLLTASTDGRRIFFDIAYLESLTDDERKFVLAHELWHCVLLHFKRLQNREHKLFNIATDKEVNQLLKDDGMNPPEGLLFPTNDEMGLSAEEIYEKLLKSADKDGKIRITSDSKNDKTEKNESGKKGNSRRMHRWSKDDSEDNTEKSNEDDGVQFDKHIYDDYSDENEESDKTSRKLYDKYGEIGIDEDYSPIITDDIAERMREATIAAAQFTERSQGDLPAHIRRIVERYVKPEISWKELLAQFVTSCYNGQSNWIPPNRRYVYRDTYLQSRRHPEINVAVAIDTSGSTSADLPKFLSELKALLESFGGYDLTLIQCDCAIDSVEQYDDSNPFPTEIGKEFEFSGGGGTSFVPVFDYLFDNGIEPSCLIYFTDSFGDAPKNPPPYPVLWVLTADGNEDFCEWGTKIKFKERSVENNNF